MQFIDLNRQYEVLKTDMDRRLEKVMSENHFIMGPEVFELEDRLKEFTGRKYCLTCASGTDALVIPLLTYNLQKNDAVFVSSFTFFASAESICTAGGTPVFIDSDSSFNMDPEALETTIRKTLDEGILNPKGIVAVDIFGLSADYDKILKIANKYNLFVIEDAAQAFGGQYKGKPTCSFGNVSATSFFPAKPLGCYGDGGAIFTDDDSLYEIMHSLRVHGHGSSKYDNVRIGMNSRLDTLQAAVLLSKLTVFRHEIELKNQIADKYSALLKNYFVTPEIPNDRISPYAQYTLLAENSVQRDAIVNGMKEFDIPIMVYYSVPMHCQTAFRYLGYSKTDLPVCADFSDRVFSIPMHPYLTDREINFIANNLIRITENTHS